MSSPTSAIQSVSDWFQSKRSNEWRQSLKNFSIGTGLFLLFKKNRQLAGRRRRRDEAFNRRPLGDGLFSPRKFAGKSTQFEYFKVISRLDCVPAANQINRQIQFNGGPQPIKIQIHL